MNANLITITDLHYMYNTLICECANIKKFFDDNGLYMNTGNTNIDLFITYNQYLTEIIKEEMKLCLTYSNIEIDNFISIDHIYKYNTIIDGFNDFAEHLNNYNFILSNHFILNPKEPLIYTNDSIN